MKVLMLSWEFRPNVVGGLGKAVTELVPALVAEGVEVHLVTIQAGDAPETETLPGAPSAATSSTVTRVPPPAGDARDVYALAERTNVVLEDRAERLIDALGGVDLIHAHDWLVAPAAVPLKRAHRLPLVATIHATEYGRHRGHVVGDLSRSIHNAEWRLTFESWRVICCSQFMATEAMAAFRTPADKVDVIPNGVDSAPFDALEGLDLGRFRAGYVAPEEQIVLTVGRIVHEKGAHLLVEAHARVLRELPTARLVITGDGPHLPAVRLLAEELGILDRVSFTGFVPIDVRNRLLKVADVAVFPSLYEPFGIVALEAMAARAPVVASDVGGLAEVVTHGETGILVHPNDADSLAWGILYTLQRPERSRRRVENAYRMAEEAYNWRAIARRTIEVYRRVVAERARTSW